MCRIPALEMLLCELNVCVCVYISGCMYLGPLWLTLSFALIGSASYFALDDFFPFSGFWSAVHLHILVAIKFDEVARSHMDGYLANLIGGSHNIK